MATLRTPLLALVLLGCSGAGAKPVVVESDTPAIGKGSIVAQFVGLELVTGEYAAVLPRGCRVPCSRTFSTKTSVDGQERITLSLVRGVVLVDRYIERVGSVQLLGIPKAPKGRMIEVTLRAARRHLSIEAIDVETQTPLAIRLVLME